MYTVTFNSPDEYLEELRKDAEVGFGIDRKIVRATIEHRGSPVSPNIRLVTAVSTYAVNTVTPTVVKLSRFCGQHWGMGNEHDQQVDQEAEAVLKKVEGVCKELGLDFRAGIIGHAMGEATAGGKK